MCSSQPPKADGEQTLFLVPLSVPKVVWEFLTPKKIHKNKIKGRTLLNSKENRRKKQQGAWTQSRLRRLLLFLQPMSVRFPGVHAEKAASVLWDLPAPRPLAPARPGRAQRQEAGSPQINNIALTIHKLATWRRIFPLGSALQGVAGQFFPCLFTASSWSTGLRTGPLLPVIVSCHRHLNT